MVTYIDQLITLQLQMLHGFAVKCIIAFTVLAYYSRLVFIFTYVPESAISHSPSN